MYQSLYFSIKEAYLSHRTAFNDKLNGWFVQTFIRELRTPLPERQRFSFRWGNSLLLFQHYNRKVVGCHWWVWCSDSAGISEQVLWAGNRLYGEISLASFEKDNEDLEFGILTGILRVAKESLFSGLNNLVVNTILDESTRSISALHRRGFWHGYLTTGRRISLVQRWYDGYLFGNTEVYNPWSSSVILTIAWLESFLVKDIING